MAHLDDGQQWNCEAMHDIMKNLFLVLLYFETLDKAPIFALA